MVRKETRHHSKEEFGIDASEAGRMLSEDEQSELALVYSVLERLRRDVWRLLEICGDCSLDPRMGPQLAGALGRTRRLVGYGEEATFKMAEAQLKRLSEGWDELRASDAALLLGVVNEILDEFRVRYCDDWAVAKEWTDREHTERRSPPLPLRVVGDSVTGRRTVEGEAIENAPITEEGPPREP